LLLLLIEGEIHLSQIARLLRISKNHARHHLKTLEDEEKIISRKVGKYLLFSVNQSNP
jgi:predicted ArsR family transcriptional regulator